MVYTPNTPLATDVISASQAVFNANFQALNTRFTEDHYEYTFAGGAPAPYNIAVAGDKGKHRKITLVRVSANPAAPGADEGRLITKTATGATHLFFQNAANIYQLTGLPVTLPVLGATYEGTMTLPGGVVVKWGKFFAATTNGTYNFTSGAFPTTAAVVLLTQFSNNVRIENPVALNFTNLKFDWFACFATNFYTFIAIGH